MDRGGDEVLIACALNRTEMAAHARVLQKPWRQESPLGPVHDICPPAHDRQEDDDRPTG